MSAPAARRTKRGQVVSYGDGRVCATPECLTKLSRYNATEHCALHDEAARRDRLGEGRRPLDPSTAPTV